MAGAANVVRAAHEIAAATSVAAEPVIIELVGADDARWRYRCSCGLRSAHSWATRDGAEEAGCTHWADAHARQKKSTDAPDSSPAKPEPAELHVDGKAVTSLKLRVISAEPPVVSFRNKRLRCHVVTAPHLLEQLVNCRIPFKVVAFRGGLPVLEADLKNPLVRERLKP